MPVMHTKWCHAISMHAQNRTILSLPTVRDHSKQRQSNDASFCISLHICSFNGKPQVTDVDVSSNTIIHVYNQGTVRSQTARISYK